MNILSLFDAAKLIRIGLIAAGCLTAWGAVKYRYESQGVEKERARVELKSNQNAKKADAARRSAAKLPPDRLRDKWCRDC